MSSAGNGFSYTANQFVCTYSYSVSISIISIQNMIVTKEYDIICRSCHEKVLYCFISVPAHTLFQVTSYLNHRLHMQTKCMKQLLLGNSSDHSYMCFCLFIYTASVMFDYYCRDSELFYIGEDWVPVYISFGGSWGLSRA